MIDYPEDLVPGLELTNNLGGFSQVADSPGRFIYVYVDDFVRKYRYMCCNYVLSTQC